MMKKRIIAVLLITVMAWLLPVPYAMAENTGISQTENDAAAEAADNQVVVLYEEGEMPSEASEAKTEKAQEKILEKAQSGILDEALSGDYSIDETIVIGTEDKAENDLVVGVVSSNDFTTDELVEKLQESESVKFAEPNYVYKAKSMPAWNDNYIKDAWQLGGEDVHGVNVASAPVPAADGDPVVIAVLDTGIDYEHPDLKERMWDAPDNYNLKKGIHGIDYSDGDADPMDENGHGTHCAGIIAAAADNGTGSAGVAGKSDKIELMAVRVLDAEGAGYLEDIVKGFRHIVRARQEGVNVKAINCSLGAETSSDIFDAVIE
ncbi:MAG: S8 family serine peptidase, partial [Mogibacterium sp.]|nr:S8 family serine peptidase [Mogibacterium sp.]